MYTHKHTQKHTEGGQVMMITTLFLLAGSMVIVGALLALVKSQVRVMSELSLSKNTYHFTEGALEEVVYRHKSAQQVSPSETLTGNNVSVTTVTTAISGGKEVLATGNEDNRFRKMKTVLIEGDGVSFSFGVQTDNGGIILENSSSIRGNVYSNGPIQGFNLNLIRGTAISAGLSGHISEVHATGSAYAHDIEDSYVEDDAFYNSIDVSTIVDGTEYPGFPDLSTSTLPIPDSLIDTWAEYASSSLVMTTECATAGGEIVFDTDTTLGPAKIPCNVTFENSPEVTIAGVLWIVGNLTFRQSPEFRIDPAIGNKSVPIIIDNPANRLTSSKVSLRNSGTWTGNGDHSYIMLLSRNESAELGGPEKAITIEQSSGGALLVYAGHGEILMQNNTDLTEITAHRVRLQNSTEVIYDSGLASAVFQAGPGGSYVIQSWEEVQ